MFYNKYFKNNYEELITYYPKFYREVFEMRAILESEGKLADDIENNIERVFNNCFIDTADEITIRKLEEFFGLKLYKQRTLQDRRRLVKALFAGGGKVSASMISEMISAYTGAKVTCTFEPFDEAGNNKLNIYFERGKEKTLCLSDIFSLLEKRIPAHIEYRTALIYSFPIGIGRNRKCYKYSHELCGTKPETATKAEAYSISAETSKQCTSCLKAYESVSDISNEAGTLPTAAVIGQKLERSAMTDQSHISCLKTYPATSESRDTGTIPTAAVIASEKSFDSASDSRSLSAGINYIPCGTTFTQS